MDGTLVATMGECTQEACDMSCLLRKLCVFLQCAEDAWTQHIVQRPEILLAKRTNHMTKSR